MVNLRRLTQTAQKAKGVIDQQIEQQGGPDALKEKAQKMKTAAQGPGSMSDKAKAAAAVAREKPNPASPTAGDDVGGPIGGGDAPPNVAAAPPAPDPAAASAPGASPAVEDPGPTIDPAVSAPGETASEPVESVPEEQADDPPSIPPAPEPDDAKPNPDGPSEPGKSGDR